MHGYFVSLQLYDTARVIANPFAYAEHREKLVRERMEKLAETRIRSKKDAGRGVKVNKALAEKIERDAEKERKREERKRAKKAGAKGEVPEDEQAMDVDLDNDDHDDGDEGAERPTLLNDPRFKDLFENPEFAVDETTREYALLHPSASAQKRNVTSRAKTAVEEEEEESDKVSSDILSEEESNSDDSSDAGGESLRPVLYNNNTHTTNQSLTNSTRARDQARRMNAYRKHTLVPVSATVALMAMSTLSPLCCIRTPVQGRWAIRQRPLDSGGSRRSALKRRIRVQR